MTELHELLEHATTDPIEIDVAADLRRGHRALTRRRTWWSAAMTGGVVAAGAVAYAALPMHQATVTVRPADGGDPTPSQVQPHYYDVPEPPLGWHVVGERAQYVMLTQDGSGVTSIDSSFIGQLVIGLTDGRERFDTGPSVDYDGRTFYLNDRNDDATIVSVRAPGGDWLQAQYPKAAFTDRELIAYLDGVVVEPGARPAFG